MTNKQTIPNINSIIYQWEGYSLRSTNSLSTGHAVLETMSPQTGDIIINYLHFSAFKACILKQVQLVICAVLWRQTTGLNPPGWRLQ